MSVEFPATYEEFCKGLGQSQIRLDFQTIGKTPPPEVLENQFMQFLAGWREDYHRELQSLKTAATAALEYLPGDPQGAKSSLQDDIQEVFDDLGPFLLESRQEYLKALISSYQDNGELFKRLMEYFVKLGSADA